MRGIVSWLTTAILSAICLVLGFAPAEWIATVFFQPPPWLYGIWARLIAAVLGLCLGWWTFRMFGAWRGKEQHPVPIPGDVVSSEVRRNNSAPIEMRISLVELGSWAAIQGWRFTADGSQHIFDFVRTLRDAGSTESVQFWGREKKNSDSMTRDQALEKISAEYWKLFKIDGISLLRISPASGNADGLISDNFHTTTVSDGNLRQRRLYADIYLDRERSKSWLETEGVKRRGEYISRDSEFDGLDTPFYLQDRETDLTTAVFMMVHNSFWGRRQFEGQKLSPHLNDMRDAMQKAAIEVRGAAKEGKLTIHGTMPGTSQQKAIPAADWKYAVLEVQPCTTLGWKVAASPNDGNWNRDNRAWLYEDLEVDSLEFEHLWPEIG